MEEFSKIQNVVIYGDSDFAEQVYFQLETDVQYKVLAFTVDKNRFIQNTYFGLPVYPFQELDNHFKKNEIKIFIAIGYSKMNTIREAVFKEITDNGYKLLTYISKYAIIGKNAAVGIGSFICEFVSIGCNSKIGKGVIILPHTSIAHDVSFQDFIFCSHSACIGGKTEIHSNSFIGLNATLKNNITVAEKNIIGSASNVVKSTEPNSIYIGNPAKRIKNIDLNNLKI